MTAAEDELRAIAGLQGGTLRVGAFLSAYNSFLPSALARFEEEHPEVQVSFEQLEGPRHCDASAPETWTWRSSGASPGFPGPGRVTRDAGFDQLDLFADPHRWSDTSPRRGRRGSAEAAEETHVPSYSRSIAESAGAGFPATEPGTVTRPVSPRT